MISDPLKPCWACRKARLVCDFTKPACRKCQARGHECPGYDSKPLVWIPNGTVKAKQRKNCRKMDQQQNSQKQGLVRKSRNEISAPSRPPLWAIREPLSADLSDLAIQIIDYYNTCISPDVAASGVAGAGNPYIIPPEVAPYLSSTMLYTMSCLVLGHRVLQMEESEHRTALKLRLQEHRGTTICALSEAISTKSTQANDETLWCVLAFLLSEVCGPQVALWQPARSPSASSVHDSKHSTAVTPGWRLHVDGASSIIELRGGLPKLVVSNPPMRPMLLFYIVVDVMSSTTSPPLSTGKALRQLEITNILPIIYGDGLATTTPCPPELFAVVVRINHTRSIRDGTDAPIASFFPIVRDLLNQIEGFSPDVWAAKATASQQARIASRIEDLDAASDELYTQEAAVYTQSQEFLNWRRIATVFQSAVGLYCICSLLGAEPDEFSNRLESGADPHELKRRFQGILYQNLKEIIVVTETRSERMRKLVLWPLVVAGTQLSEEHEQMKVLVKKELKWLSLALGTSSPLMGVNLLDRVWGGGMGFRAGQRPSWDIMFDRPYSFVI